ncbi:MAG: TRAP transporter small permease [Desulfobacteraceae bacterium]|nr:TRAP transporter small permease [Desulfobacteraceae bacterium]
MNFIYKINYYLNQALVILAGCCLLTLIFLTSANVILRFFGRPIQGTFELMGYLGALAGALALGFTQMRRGHIAVDVLFNSFPVKLKKAMNIINYTVCGTLFALAGWQLFEKATILKNTGEVTETLRIVYYPFTYATAVGFFVLTLVLLTELLKSIIPEKEK